MGNAAASKIQYFLSLEERVLLFNEQMDFSVFIVLSGYINF